MSRFYSKVFEQTNLISNYKGLIVACGPQKPMSQHCCHHVWQVVWAVPFLLHTFLIDTSSCLFLWSNIIAEQTLLEAFWQSVICPSHSWVRSPLHLHSRRCLTITLLPPWEYTLCVVTCCEVVFLNVIVHFSRLLWSFRPFVGRSSF